MLTGFDRHDITVAEVRIATWVGGSGPPLLLLHGYPQTHSCWHLVAPRLAERFTVVVPDLRGYGDSDKPRGSADHREYSKRTMAADCVAVMHGLGYRRFGVAGHDRGGRVGHRMALDHPDGVDRLAVLDIVPTRTLFLGTDRDFATAYYHWFFLIQPDGLPERMIGADPEWFLRETVRRWSGPGRQVGERALAEYVRCFADPAAIHGSCEDYRAAASIDLEHDAEDPGPLRQPLLVLWGEHGAMHRLNDVRASWEALADDVRGRALPCGHFLPEECPDQVTEALLEFFTA